ncbi:MAG: PAS domain S-box protein [Actinomycetota bacterium]
MINQLLLYPLNEAIVRQPLTISQQANVAEVLACMSQAQTADLPFNGQYLPDSRLFQDIRASCVFAVHNSQLVGLFTERDVVRLTAKKANLSQVQIVDVIARNLVTLKESDLQDLFNVLNQFRRHQIRHLPILSNSGQLMGMVTPESLQKVLRLTNLLQPQRVEELMSTRVIHAPRTASILTTAELMIQHRVNYVTIVESNGCGDLVPVGLISERDIVQFQAMKQGGLHQPAHTLMHPVSFCLKPDDSLFTASEQMQQQSVPALMVSGEQGQLRGILTVSHLLQALEPLQMYGLIEKLQQSIYQLETEKVASLQQRNAELEKQVQERTTQLQEQSQRSRLISSIALRIHQCLSLEETLSTTVREVQQFLGCDRVLLYHLWPDGTGRAITEAVNPDWPSVLGKTFPAEVFPEEYHQLYSQGRVRAIDDVENTKIAPCLSEFLHSFGAKAKIVVPILQQEKLWGLLIAHHCCHPRQWHPLEIDLLKQLATHIAIALQQSELYQQAQTELRERQRSHSLLCATFDSTADGILVTDCQGNLLNFNKRFVDLWGIPPSILESGAESQAVAFFQEQLHKPVDFEETIRQLYNQPQRVSWDLLELKGGRYLERYSQPQYLEDQMIGRVWSFRDVTVQKLAEVALATARDELEIKVEERTTQLRNSEERFRNLVETTSDWIWEMDRNAIYTYISPKIYEILGYEPEQVVGKTPFEFMSPEEAFRLANLLGPTAALQEPFICIEQKFYHQNCGLVLIETNAVPFFDKNGNLEGYRGINRDITERKRAEERLRQQALAFENIYDSIVITDLSGKIVDWNPSSERIFGYSQSEVLGQPIGILYSLEEPFAFTQQILDEILCHDRWKGEISSTRRDGSECICESVVVPLYSETGQMIAMIAVNHDITERKRAETEVLRALEKEKELGELKTRFVTMASHEFRTPLATIFVASDLLKAFGSKLSEPQKQEQLNKIQSEIKNMTQLLEDILVLGKASSGRLEFKPIQFNIEAFCREILSEIASTTSVKHRFNFNCWGDCHFVEMDQKLLRQMIGNLLSNAVKYSPPGTCISFEVSCEPEIAIFKVQDQGIGIPLSDRPRIFEAFHRASNVGNISGTGLGLTIVKQAVELHGGTIKLESQVGVGTTFTVLLPLGNSES